MLSKTELEGLTVKSALGGSLTRGFTMSGFLSKTELESLLAGAVRTTVINGGAAGDHTVTGIEVGDALRAVLKLDVTNAEHAAHSHANTFAAAALQGDDLAAVKADHATEARHTLTNVEAAAMSHTRTWSVADLTDEFSITDDDTINNDGGTNTTGAVLVVVYEDLTP